MRHKIFLQLTRFNFLVNYYISAAPFRPNNLNNRALLKEMVPEYTDREFTMPDPGPNIWHNFGLYNHQVFYY